MLEEIIEIAREHCENEIEWGGDTSILTDMELSSLEIFEFICDVEARFSIHLKERQLSEIVTLSDLAEAVERERDA